ncbi:MAG TPA: hypothetical protein PLC61_07715 [Chitinophagales bacterium]|nr:hypothetical protein [Chitinophagales bacterium]HMU97420.1 hypothetical protein [Chitinophagales bacterium]HMV01990.1 hypothetical protein [Chitinophagales bacterium]HMW93366.1 hypothetical protein [Chitinophagales bacterium]HMY41692.1 hypothetical protein [Chitinophagales bacterium]
MKKILYILIFTLVIVSCKKETETIELSNDYNYFPTKIGSYIIYKGDSILYNYFFSEVKRTKSFYLKEVVSDTSRDNLNRLAYEVDIFESQDLNSTWTHKVKWYKVIDNKTAESVEDNLRYLKLVFPSKVGLTWNANKFISDRIPYIYAIDSTLDIFNSRAVIIQKDVTYTNSFTSFDSTLTVVNLIDSSGVDYYKFTEKYARNIGLVYKEQWNVVAKDPGRNPNLPWIDRARLGFYLKLEAIEYGQE